MQELSEKNRPVRERLAAKREATKNIVAYILDNEDSVPEEIMEAAKILLPKHGGGGVRENSKKAQFLEMLEAGKVHEDDLFLKLKLGRVEARNIINDVLKGLPEDRVWINFDKENGEYEIVAKGAKMPKGWEGYVPQDLREEDIEINEVNVDLLDE